MSKNRYHIKEYSVDDSTTIEEVASMPRLLLKENLFADFLKMPDEQNLILLFDDDCNLQLIQIDCYDPFEDYWYKNVRERMSSNEPNKGYIVPQMQCFYYGAIGDYNFQCICTNRTWSGDTAHHFFEVLKIEAYSTPAKKQHWIESYSDLTWEEWNKANDHYCLRCNEWKSIDKKCVYE